MPFKAHSPALAAAGVVVLLLAGCGSPTKDPDQTVSAHPAADPPSRLCAIVGPALIRQAVPGATRPAKSTTIDQRPDAYVNRTVAQCALQGSGRTLLITLTRYGPARDGSGTRHVRGGLQRAREFFTEQCGDAITAPPSPPAEHAGDQDCLTGPPSKKGHHSASFYRSRRGSDEITVAYTIDRSGPQRSTSRAIALSRHMARNIWKAIA